MRALELARMLTDAVDQTGIDLTVTVYDIDYPSMPDPLTRSVLVTPDADDEFLPYVVLYTM